MDKQADNKIGIAYELSVLYKFIQSGFGFSGSWVLWKILPGFTVFLNPSVPS